MQIHLIYTISNRNIMWYVFQAWGLPGAFLWPKSIFVEAAGTWRAHLRTCLAQGHLSYRVTACLVHFVHRGFLGLFWNAAESLLLSAPFVVIRLPRPPKLKNSTLQLHTFCSHLHFPPAALHLIPGIAVSRLGTSDCSLLAQYWRH